MNAPTTLLCNSVEGIYIFSICCFASMTYCVISGSTDYDNLDYNVFWK